ncbi:hypothetical protein BVRB_9g202740 [Beta vulgaris subsp. vulgaris]|nr:hypothetical protein BVRB_9g202740 [Beta vulgaris subsp. vulgaris]
MVFVMGALLNSFNLKQKIIILARVFSPLFQDTNNSTISFGVSKK